MKQIFNTIYTPKNRVLLLVGIVVGWGFLTALLTSGSIYVCFISHDTNCFDNQKHITEFAVFVIGLPFGLYFHIGILYGTWKEYLRSKLI